MSSAHVSLWERLGRRRCPLAWPACEQQEHGESQPQGQDWSPSLSFYSLPCGCLRFEGKQGANAVLEVSGLSRAAQSSCELPMDEWRQGLSPQLTTAPYRARALSRDSGDHTAVTISCDHPGWAPSLVRYQHLVKTHCV